MCGISGIINKGNFPVDKELIKKINDLICHRGPDGEGFYFGNSFAFGHRRLSIIDLTAHGSQPMSYKNRYWITYNGEVYNYIEIKEELISLGHSFVSGSDTEVILAAYDQWGYKCLNRFNGMWAFAIFDSQKDIVFLARDRFGIKPLYYSNKQDQFIFGSEIKQLLALQETIKANRRVVIESLLTSIDGHTEETYFADINSFPSSHFAVYNLRNHSLKIERYYKLKINQQIKDLPLNVVEKEFRELLDDAIKIRLRSDVKVGTCLSGGLDSSVTSSIASGFYHKCVDEKFIGIHAKSSDAESDESDFAKLVSDYLNLDLHIVEPDTDDFLNKIDELIYTQEEPFGSPSMFMGWHVFEKAKALGCKVMLNGQGGDEVLLGYERYYASFLKSISLLSFFKEAKAISSNSKLNLKNLLLYNFYFTNATLRIRQLKKRSFLLPQIKRTFDFNTIRKSTKSFKDIEALQLLEISSLQLPHLLRYEDRNSMRHSIETRLPFLDYRLVEFCLSIAPEFKIQKGWTKYILRKATEDVLPPSISWRKDKKGFEAPEKTWIGSSSGMMKKTIQNSKILSEIIDLQQLLSKFNELPFKRRWNYFMIAAWEKKFEVSW
jgi:asparagine synthase (glutamine-hydrolysing)